MTLEEAQVSKGFKLLGTIALWIGAAGFVAFGSALFHFFSWWGVMGCAGVALISIASLLPLQLFRAEVEVIRLGESATLVGEDEGRRLGVYWSQAGRQNPGVAHGMP